MAAFTCNSKISVPKINLMYLTGSLCFGGLERVVVNLCKNVDRSIFQPMVVCTDVKGEFSPEVENIGIPVYGFRVGRNRLAANLIWYQVRKIARSENIHIIHSHNTGPFLDAFFSTIFRSTVCIHTDHARSFPDKWRYMLAERIAARRAYKVVAVSDETRKNLIKYEHIPNDKITVINNGIEKCKFDIRLDKASKREDLGLTRFKEIVGMGVVLTKQKGIVHLIQAAPSILGRFPQTGFLIAGDGPIRAELEAESRKNGVADQFVFIGSRKDIPEILQVIDIYILPSLWEGLPLVILEAMAARRCIIASAVGAIPLAIRNRLDGVLIPPGDPADIARTVIALLEKPQLRRRLAENAHRRFLEHFTAEKMTREYEKIYLEAFVRKFGRQSILPA